MNWAQAPTVMHSADPRVTGQLEVGDYIHIRSAVTEDGYIRVKVYPHDYRTVGHSDDQVWIDWGTLELFRLDREVFVCEDSA